MGAFTVIGCYSLILSLFLNKFCIFLNTDRMIIICSNVIAYEKIYYTIYYNCIMGATLKDNVQTTWFHIEFIFRVKHVIGEQ
jgi:hypothetical protein